jgi:type II secretory pathway pseudopilin PulG
MTNPDAPARRPAFTLVELVVSSAVMTIIALGISSVIVLASRALPSARGASENTVAASGALDQLVAELRTATAVSELGASAVTFTVPDRDGNGADETIRYAWTTSGAIVNGPSAGAALTRAFNGGTPATILPSVNNFALAYNRRKVTTTQNTGSANVDSGEVLLSSFAGWSGVSNPSTSTSALSTTSWASQAFTVDKVSFPADTIRWYITRVSFRVGKGLTSTAAITATIWNPASAGSPVIGTQVGSAGTIAMGLLSITPSWQDASFSDVTITDRTATSLVVLLKGTASGAQVEYLNSTSAPTDANVFLWTTNSGGAWSPSSNRQQNDAKFFVYGGYVRSVPTTTSVDTYYLGSVNVTLQPTSDAASRVDSGFALLNQPQVTGP